MARAARLAHNNDDCDTKLRNASRSVVADLLIRVDTLSRSTSVRALAPLPIADSRDQARAPPSERTPRATQTSTSRPQCGRRATSPCRRVPRMVVCGAADSVAYRGVNNHAGVLSSARTTTPCRQTCCGAVTIGVVSRTQAAHREARKAARDIEKGRMCAAPPSCVCASAP